MLDISDTNGLVCGYRVGADGIMEELEWSTMDSALADQDSVVWLHFNQADARSIA
jgi:hypothetical protein